MVVDVILQNIQTLKEILLKIGIALLPLLISSRTLPKEIHIKRKIFFDILRKYRTINNTIKNINEKLFPSKLHNFITIFCGLLYLPILIVLSYWLTYKNDFIKMIVLELIFSKRLINPMVIFYLILSNIIISLALWFIYFTFSEIYERKKPFKDGNYAAYWMYLALRPFYAVSLLSSIYGFIAAKYLPILENVIERSALVELAFIIGVIPSALLLSFFWIGPRGYIKSVQKHIIDSELKKFRQTSPYLVVSTKNGKVKGHLWDLFDKRNIVLKSVGYIHIPWNEITWIEIFESEDQNRELIKELKKDKSDNPSFWKRPLMLLKHLKEKFRRE